MGEERDVTTPVLAVIQDIFGSSTMEMYRVFYKGKPESVVRESAIELFREALGRVRAERELARIFGS